MICLAFTQRGRLSPVCDVIAGRSQRDVVYLGGPVAPSYMSPNAGGWCCGVSANEYSCAHGALINFGDPTLFFEPLCHLLVLLYIYFMGDKAKGLMGAIMEKWIEITSCGLRHHLKALLSVYIYSKVILCRITSSPVQKRTREGFRKCVFVVPDLFLY